MQKYILGSFTILLIIIILAVSYFLWYTPSKIVGAALAKLAAADSQRFVSTINISNTAATQQLLGEQASIQLAVSGVYKKMADQRDQVDAQVKLTTDTESVTMRFESDVRFIGDKAYLHITKTPPAFPALVQVKDIWIELPRGGSTDSALENYDGKLLTDITRGEQREINGQRLREYRAVATSGAIIKIIDNVAAVLGTRLTDSQVTEIKNGLSQVGSVPGTLLIDTWRRQLRQIEIVIDAPNNNKISIITTFSKNKENNDITPPENAVTLEQIQSALNPPSQ